MYTDVKGLITTGIGNLIDPISHAVGLPWIRKDGTPASKPEIVAAWQAVKGDTNAARAGHRYAERLTTIRLTDAGVAELVAWKLEQMSRYLLGRFGPDYLDWPACAQLATLSMSWACGPAFRFPTLEAALRRRDWIGAANSCTISEAGNPGIKPRNTRNRILYRNADRVARLGLDENILNWESYVGIADEITEPTFGSSVTDLQKALARKGYAPGPADGIPGPRTKAALLKFQCDSGLVADGVAGAKTWLALRS